ncbi:Ig-like domain repeat protein [Aeromicrobium sp. NPDC092404]|uniref:Ig-like domain repeat protein n=1 Tax=Aeromicrobium sp. NPDC092404 TaxID=3154976 RepID=UPI00342FCEB8
MLTRLTAAAALTATVLLAPTSTQATPAPPHPGGDVVAFGSATDGKLDVPPLPSGMSYVEVDGGYNATVALRSDGHIVGWGHEVEQYSSLTPPDLPSGTTYTDVSTNGTVTLALRSDGVVVPFATTNPYGTSMVPPLPADVQYTDLQVGSRDVLALRSDGHIVAWGEDNFGLHAIPALPDGVTYTTFAVTMTHALALRSDGRVVAWGATSQGKTDVPDLPEGTTYTGVAAGLSHSVVIRSDGEALAFGQNDSGQAEVPPLPDGLTYIDASAGFNHTLFLRSDGSVVGSGVDADGQLAAPAPDGEMRNVAMAGGFSHSAVIRATVPDSVTTAAWPATITYGKPSVVPITVSTAHGSPPPGPGTVRITGSDGRPIAAGTTDADGKATLEIGATALKPGSHALRVTFMGSPTAWRSESQTRTMTVGRAVSTAALSVPSHMRAGTRRTASVTVRATGVTPTGKVRIMDGSRVLREFTMLASFGGRRAVLLPKLREGKHRLRLRYVGSAHATSDWSLTHDVTVRR